ncbi:hypothetical protein [uncultured Nitratireductor sp.]|uniref:hypothetical protein n=1 Tax=uncultured Nitratireductor sp. TaxID=520953 RepID=UPI002600E914|nr:hypothetical protein [uncultured Nitratireductor sp.]
MRRTSLTAFFLAIVFTSPAAAITDTVIFNGNVLSTCLITLGTPGILASNGDFSVLSSTEAGGASGSATILTTGTSFSVSTSTPAAFIAAPTGGDDNVTFASSYSASGVTTLLDVVGSVTSPLGLGLTNVDVDMSATKSTGTFPAGSYTAEVTLTCE